MEAILSTKRGKFYIQFSERGLSVLSYNIPSKLENNQSRHEFSKLVKTQLDEYFQGKRKDFDISLDIDGTEFQKRVWKQLQKIRYGKTSSYGEISKKLGIEKGGRAIGGANNKNPVMIIIPCHRVIQSDGKLGGYAGGVELKKLFLDLEMNNK